jgi:2-desacetyl-2-hydroxyethyl bacteriochlorophyllide A dehydrogenase
MFAGPRRVELESIDVGDAGPGQVLVRTAYSGISGGTEMLAYRGEVDPAAPLDETLGAFAGTFAFPHPYGYSCVGVVERSGGDVAEGARVFAFHPHQDVFVIDERDVVALGSADLRTATLFPLVETALQVTLDAGARLGEAVAVFGQGAVGILIAALLQRSGAEVLGVEPDPARRDAASAFGIRAVEPVALADHVATATGGWGVALAIEASGDPSALRQALSILAHEGTALVCSWFGTKDVPLPLGAQFHRRRLTIRSTQVSTIPSSLAPTWDRSRRRAVTRDLLDELPLKLLATHEFDFEQAPVAFEAVDRGEPGLIHAALRYP